MGIVDYNDSAFSITSMNSETKHNYTNQNCSIKKILYALTMKP